MDPANEVEVADRFAAAAEAAATWTSPTRGSAVRRSMSRAIDGGDVEETAAGNAGLEQADPVSDGGDLLVTKASDPFELAGGDGLFEIIDGFDLSLFPEQGDGLGARPGMWSISKRPGGTAATAFS